MSRRAQQTIATWIALTLILAIVGTFIGVEIADRKRAARFIGHWRLVGDDGVTRAWLTIRTHRALRGHVSHLPCVPRIEGDEMHLEWDDGFHDVLKIEGGQATLLALGDEGEVRFRLKAVRRENP